MLGAVGTTAYAYAAGGQLWTEDGPWSSDTVTNGYSNRLRMSLSLAQPTGSWTNGFGYDPAKRLTNVTSQAGAFGYTFVGQASRLTQKLSLPNSSYITNTYDAVARLTGTYLKNSTNGTLDAYTYLYNPGNQRTNLTRTDASTYDFTYDPIGQLTGANGSVNAEDRGYLYDAAWNLNYRTNNGALATFNVDPKNQLTNATPVGTQTYDSDGNVTWSGGTANAYSYDDENRLANWYFYSNGANGNGSPTSLADLRTECVYDGHGRLRRRLEYTVTGASVLVWTLATETRYVYDGMRVIQERNSANTPQVSYTRGTDLSGSLEGAGGIGGLLARSHGYSSGNWSTHNCYHADGKGNVTFLLNSAQTRVAEYRYDPFGNTISSSGTLAAANVYRFSSKEIHVNSGLYYYGYRWYAPDLQRWLNRDPIGEPGFEVLHRSAPGLLGSGPNLYEFVSNTPLNMVDSLGLEPILPPGWHGFGKPYDPSSNPFSKPCPPCLKEISGLLSAMAAMTLTCSNIQGKSSAAQRAACAAAITATMVLMSKVADCLYNNFWPGGHPGPSIPPLYP